ncbi:MAG: 4-(cytidine 5'-diphospho)-2-C-methyl-D-erythritol kinase [Lachnospiraceae bacterium]|nr:4-(cytidine 5'-diphospho)-2-C-methyl-D-erythritol kinase [Lachnospiraceae bacterium]
MELWMDYINVSANAKINIALDVLGKRPDGYHDLRSVMQTIDLKDNIYIRKIFTPKIKIVSNVRFLPTDERNLCHKACKALFDKYNPDFGVYIEIDKNIPVSAGLGGGSADCAATLIGVKELLKFPVSYNELLDIGKTLGADVPFCMEKGTMLAEGIGDRLTRLTDHPPVYILLAKPNVSVSTAKVFSNLVIEDIKRRPDMEAVISAINRKDLKAIAENLSNVLETVTIKEYPMIEHIKSRMTELGALSALMSGSGPTVFGYFENKENAWEALKQIKSEFRLREIFVSGIS